MAFVKDEITDEYVLGIMIDGGEKLCDYALKKWIGYAYGKDEEMRRGYINQWNETKRSIRPLAKKLLKLL